MPKISVIVNTLNEEANLADCLASVRDLADEIVVVDMHSDDRTVAIAEEHGAKVYQHDRVGYVEPARNFAFGKATGEWLLILDADERATPGLCAEVRRILAAPEADVYYVPRKNLFLGQWVEHGLWWPDYQLRLWKRGKIVWPNEIHGIPQAEGATARIAAKPEQAMIHHAYETISEFMDMVNGYTKYEVETLHREGYHFRRRHLVVATGREFWRRYVTAKGYRDGWMGLVLAFLHMSYRGVAIIKYWEKYGKKDFRDRDQGLVKAVSRVILDK